ncbi:MAG: hypothetical protein LW731_06995 [Oxalobacteraceae bacterium]|nr:hypothetical protein [Oxalobacteraceae bacterium]
MLSGPEQAALPGRLNPIYLEGRPLQLETPIAQQLGLRDGQVVQASVELRGEVLKLLLNGKLFDLPPALRFRPGDSVFLRAYQGANGWLLKIFDPAAQPAATAAAPASAPELPAAQINASRLAALSLRPPMSPTLLDVFAPRQAAALLQTTANPELAALFQRMQLSMRGLSSASLQAAVLGSGLWMEALLSRGQSAPATDTKAWLRRMIRALGDKETSVVARLNKAIEDIESAQVESLAAQSRGELSFGMVLPFADANPVQIRFFRPARQPGGEAPPFSVDIHTQNEVLGEIWLKTSITRASHVDLMMWALKGSSVRLAQKHRDALGERLKKAGLTMDSFRIFHAARPSLPEGWSPPAGAMLDVCA